MPRTSPLRLTGSRVWLTLTAAAAVMDDIVAAFTEVAASIGASRTVGSLTALGLVAGLLGGSSPHLPETGLPFDDLLDRFLIGNNHKK